MSVGILVVDDDTALAEVIGMMLEREGYTPSFCADGLSALDTFRALRPDLVLLDVLLPGMSGVDVCRLLRAESDVPIIMLTACTDTQDVVAGLEAGADDYVTKPFRSKELLARVRARLRRGRDAVSSDHVRAGDLDIDVTAHEVRRGERLIVLTPLEFDLLVTLARSPWKVFTRDELLEQVWGYQHSADTRLVNVHVQRLRAKIERNPEQPAIVLTVRGVGYRAGGSKNEGNVSAVSAGGRCEACCEGH